MKLVRLSDVSRPLDFLSKTCLGGGDEEEKEEILTFFSLLAHRWVASTRHASREQQAGQEAERRLVILSSPKSISGLHTENQKEKSERLRAPVCF